MVNIRTYIPKSEQRLYETYNKRKHIVPNQGRTIPKLNHLHLGESKEFNVAICQIDISHSTKIAEHLRDPRRFATLLSIFLTEMTYTLRDFNGELDKYTGDGGTIIFGVNEYRSIAVMNAIDFCLTLKTLITQTINPFLSQKQLPCIGIKAGIDYGKVLTERIGIKKTNDLLIVGETANFAAKLQDLASSGEILIGEDVKNHLPASEHEYIFEYSPLDEQWPYTYPIYKYDAYWILN